MLKLRQRGLASALIASVVALTAVAGCNDDPSVPDAGLLAEVDTEIVQILSITDYGIEPDTATIAARALMTITNDSSESAQIVVPSQQIDTGDLLPGESVVVVFETPADAEIFLHRSEVDGKPAAVVTVEGDADD